MPICLVVVFGVSSIDTSDVFTIECLVILVLVLIILLDDLSNACNKLLACKPSYVIGYSSALDRFVRQNSHRASDLAQLKLKAVIATAEGLPFTDSSQLIRQVFGTQLVMEYGAVETGPLAYQDKDGSFPVFHAHHRLSLRGGDGPFSNEILVTSLYPRALPLMRYA